MLDRCGTVAWSETFGDLPNLQADAVVGPFTTRQEPGPHLPEFGLVWTLTLAACSRAARKRSPIELSDG